MSGDASYRRMVGTEIVLLRLGRTPLALILSSDQVVLRGYFVFVLCVILQIAKIRCRW